MAPGCESEYPNGLTSVDGVPVVDVISSGIRLAEVMASFKKAGLSWISRSGWYQSPAEELYKMSETEFPYRGSGCWRV